MKVRIYLDARGYWCVQSKHWFNFSWNYDVSFSGPNAYEKAKAYAHALKNPKYEEIK
jgi:hypothetical protein